MNQISIIEHAGGLMEAAEQVFRSGLFPCVKNKEQAATLMMFSMEKGMSPMQALEDFDIIQGRMVIKSQAALKHFQRLGGTIQYTEYTEVKVAATGEYKGNSISLDWTLEKATKAGLTGKDNWKKHTREMLRNRCVYEIIKAICPEACCGAAMEDDIPHIGSSLPRASKIHEKEVVVNASIETVDKISNLLADCLEIGVCTEDGEPLNEEFMLSKLGVDSFFDMSEQKAQKALFRIQELFNNHKQKLDDWVHQKSTILRNEMESQNDNP